MAEHTTIRSGNPLDDHSPGRWWRSSSIQLQLLVVVNGALAVCVLFFLIFDYRRDLGERVEDKTIALEEEAKTLLPAFVALQHHGRESVQQYIDTVCQRMQEDQSPGHHIAVLVDGDAFQANAHHRASSEMLEAMREAANSSTHRSRLGPSELVVGAHSTGEVTVYVSETVRNIHRSVIGDVLRRLTGFVVLSLVAAAVVNLAVARVVTRPLHELVEVVQRIGKGELGVQSRPFRNFEMNYLAHEVNSMSHALAASDRERTVQMAKAREIQQNLLPNEVAIPGVHVAHLFQPADDVGGDYYDTLRLHDGTWLVCVADVMGHGVPAALCAAMLKALLLQAVDQLTSPAAILDFINRQFTVVSLDGDFVSMILVRVIPQSYTVEYANAGHEPGLVLSPDGEAQSLSSTGILLGIAEDATWEEIKVDVTPASRLAIVTDGVTETQNARGEIFGRSRLAGLLADNMHLQLDETVERVCECLTSYRDGDRQHDDVTAVLLQFN